MTYQQNDYYGQNQNSKRTQESSNSRSPNQKDYFNPVRQLKDFLDQNISTQKNSIKKPTWVVRDPKPREKVPPRFTPYQTSIRLHSPKSNNQVKAPKKIYLDNSFGRDFKKPIVSPQAKIETNYTNSSDYKLATNFIVKTKLEPKLNQPVPPQLAKRHRFP